MIEKHDFRVLIAYPNFSMMLTPSYAVGLFTALLKEQGYVVDLFDCTPYLATYEFSGEPNSVTLANKLMASRKFDPDALFGDPKTDLTGDFARTLDDFKPNAVIFSTVVEDTWPQTRDLLEVLSNYPEIKSIVGGIYTTMAPADVIAHEYVQCIGEGEGERTIVEFCEAVRHGVPPIRINGTRAKDENGQVICNPAQSLVNVNDVMPDFSLFDERRFYRPLGAHIWKAIPIETYRGCPYTCAFCNSPTQVIIAREKEQGSFLRRKSIPTLRREFQTMIERYNPNFFYINDDAFMARPKKELAEFAEMYREFNIPFWCQTRFEDIDEEKLTWLKEVGCYRISFGLEHGNEQFRKERLYRRMSNEFIVQQAQIVTKVGIPFSVNVIIGLPYETRELFFDTVRLNREIGTFDSTAPNIFVPYHGTPLRDMAVKEGWLDPTRQTNSFVSESILKMPPPYLQADEILALQRVYALYANLPESRYAEIKRAETLDEEGEALHEALSKEFYITKYGTDETERMLTYAG
jgi:anaerobic magnesium-protoporphyrin IX monomethyl ester cyclase